MLPLCKLVQDACHIVDLHPAQHQKRVARHANVDERFLKTGAEAAHAGKMYIHAASRNRVGEGMVYTFGSVATAACSHANRHARNRRQQLGKPCFPDRIEGAYILNWRHHLLSRSRSLSCRCNVCSFTWPQMLWLISTTGASAHCPKQATVRTVNFWSAVV